MLPAVFLSLAMTLTSVTSQDAQDLANSSFSHLIDDSFNTLKIALVRRKEQSIKIGEQVMINQHLSQARIQSEGNSGLVSVRKYVPGFYNFQSSKHNAQGSYGSFHDHNGYRKIVGLGEITAEMNGVQFTTKHMDYSFVQAHSTSGEWREVEDIEFPAVPTTITPEMSVQEQTAEMAEYFRAFATQNKTHRNYEPYFKPVLCYLEGYWLLNDTVVEEQQYSRFNGRKEKYHEDLLLKERIGATLGVPYDPSQRIANLPRTIIDFDEYGNPVFAQWSYRILCHPFEAQDVPLEYLRLVDDLPYRVTNDVLSKDMYYTRAARFVLDDNDTPSKYTSRTLMDKLVAQIPGLDNKQASIQESDYIHRQFKEEDANSPVINSGYYNHRYYDGYRDAMRMTTKIRGFADDNLYVALNTQDEVAGMHVFNQNGNQITDKFVKVSYLLPLEFVFLTPLDSWNPYDIEYFEDQDVRAGGRKGTQDSPFLGSMETLFPITPAEFYTTGHPKDRPVCDLIISFVYVKDRQGTVRKVAGAGIRTITAPIINGVGSVRLRFPVLPLHSEGSEVYQDLNALKVYVTQRLDEITQALLST